MPNLKSTATRLAKHGRRGDTKLLHITDDELMSLIATGKVTRNPETGLPEASWLSDRAGVVMGHMPDWEGQIPQAPGGPGALTRAFAQDDWTGGPFQSGGSSWDTGLLMGSGPDPGGSFRDWRAGEGNDITDDPVHRGIGRGVGSYFLGSAASGIFGGGPGEPGYDPGGPGSGYPSGDPAPLTYPPYDPGGDPGYPPSGQPGISDPGGYDPSLLNASFAESGNPSSFPSLRTMANSLQIGGGLYGLYTGNELRKERNEEKRRRKAYQDQIDAVMQNPDSVKNLPGYQFGLDQGTEALHRRMAAMGYGKSGNMATALQRYGTDYASSQVQSRLQDIANASGVGGPPQVNRLDPIQVAMASLRSLGYGMGNM